MLAIFTVHQLENLTCRAIPTTIPAQCLRRTQGYVMQPWCSKRVDILWGPQGCRNGGNVVNVKLHNENYHWQAFYRWPSGISLSAQRVERPTNKPELLHVHLWAIHFFILRLWWFVNIPLCTGRLHCIPETGHRRAKPTINLDHWVIKWSNTK